MKDLSHFYPRYGLALLMSEKNIQNIEDIKAADFIDLILSGLEKFRLKPTSENFESIDVTYEYKPIKKGIPEKGIFLAPHIITSDKSAQDLYIEIEGIIKEIPKINDLKKKESLKKSFAPTAGEYNNGAASRKNASVTLLEYLCCALTTISTKKPSYAQITIKDNKPSYCNTTIIPDLPLDDLRKFIRVFETILKTKTPNLLIGKTSGKEGKKKPSRPKIFRGNFPNAPISNSLCSLALLGAIGEWAKETEETESAIETLNLLQDCQIYIVNNEGTKIVGYNHFVVELARENSLKSVIDSIYRIVPLNKSSKIDFKEIERQRLEREKIAFFAARFMQLFDATSFKEFLAIRAEYPYQLEILFKTYFMDAKKIDADIIKSARQLGAWLNSIAYFIAKEETLKQPAKLYEIKAKILVELESSAFSAKTGTALISQTIVRAGRLSKSDAPNEATLFMEKTMSGELDLKDAQQMLMAFSRLRIKTETKENLVTPLEQSILVEEDFSDAQ